MLDPELRRKAKEEGLEDSEKISVVDQRSRRIVDLVEEAKVSK
jgi:hypothetical protein